MSYSLSLNKYVGKVAVVTGASSGLGKSIAEALVKQGLTVAGVARRVELVQKHAKQLENEKGKLIGLKADLSKKEDVLSVFKQITEQLGSIHVLINNAGLSLPTNIIDGDIDKWKTVLDTNVLSVAICIKEAVANMKEHDVKGHIININSVLGHNVFDVPGFNVYPASKFAVTALTETVRLEINRQKLPIKITSVSPGLVKTEATIHFSEKLPALYPEDITDAVLYVLSTPDHVNVKELTVTVQGA